MSAQDAAVPEASDPGVGGHIDKEGVLAVARRAGMAQRFGTHDRGAAEGPVQERAAERRDRLAEQVATMSVCSAEWVSRAVESGG